MNPIEKKSEMEPYLLYGTVLPERAQLSHEIELEFSHLGSGVCGRAKVSIVLNQLAVWIYSDHDWDIYDLRNMVKTLVSNQLAILGYLLGYAYDLEITRILNRSRNIDYVFGIGIQYLSERNSNTNIGELFKEIRNKTNGNDGVLLHRCFNDLVSAMKHADDTGFYCYRAIESLRHHCASRYNLTARNKNEQWNKFREVSGSDENIMRNIKEAADPLRHGNVGCISSAEDRKNLLMSTWDIVDQYLKNL